MAQTTVEERGWCQGLKLEQVVLKMGQIRGQGRGVRDSSLPGIIPRFPRCLGCEST